MKFFFAILFCLNFLIPFTNAKIQDGIVNEANMNLKNTKNKKSPAPKMNEDNIPVIEIKGEGKPMTAAQIRALEEEAEGKPLDIKIKKTWVPKQCKNPAKRLDFVTFHFKGFLEDGKKFEQTFGKDPITIQLGTGMTIPGLDKGLRGVCETELRKITVPWRLVRRRKSKVWKNVPKDEHWISFDVEIFQVDPWTPKKQFEFMDLNKDEKLTEDELVKLIKKLRHDFGKTWPNADIDDVLASRYFLKYFDTDDNKKITLIEYETKMIDDLSKAKNVPLEKNSRTRKRDPGVGWILDFDNDGFVTREEIDIAPELFEKGPHGALQWLEEKRKNSTRVKTEL